MKRLIKANANKPHRCNECHRISDKARPDGRCKWWKIYDCLVCGVCWSLLWQDMTVAERVRHWLMMRRLQKESR